MVLYSSLIKKSIDSGKNLKVKPADSSNKYKQIAFCSDLPFGILSFKSYLHVKSMNIISSSIEINEYKLLNMISLGFMHIFMKLKASDYLKFI